MSDTKDLSIDDLELKITQLDKLLAGITQLKDHELQDKNAELLEILFTRDEIEHFLDTLCNQKSSPKALLTAAQQLQSLDEQLKAVGNKVAAIIDLASWRERLEVDNTHWWWFFKSKPSSWNRFDWIWNILTTMALALAASFMINIYSAVSMGGISSIFTTFSTIMQGLGLAVIGGGALSKVGQEKIQKLLSALNIPPKFYGEITFAIAFVFLSVIFVFHNWLDDYYLKEGKEAYNQGELRDAADAYKRGLKINEDSPHFNGQLGKVYESLGQLDVAIDYYMKSVEDGNFWDFNGLGRSLISQRHEGFGYEEQELEAQQLAEAYLVLGLQRASFKLAELKDDSIDLKTKLKTLNLLYHLRKNIGWALLNQKDYPNALVNLNTAIEFEEKLQTALADAVQNISNEEYKKQLEEEFGFKRPSAGMAYCLQAQVYDELGQASQTAWETCQHRAYPEFIDELRWFYTVGRGIIACKVNSFHIVSGMSSESPKNQCKSASQAL